MLTGILHLVSNLVGSAGFTIETISEMTGFMAHVPGGEPHVRELVERIEDKLKTIRNIIDNNKMFAVIEDDKNE
jgi:hypothetical protein